MREVPGLFMGAILTLVYYTALGVGFGFILGAFCASFWTVFRWMTS